MTDGHESSPRPAIHLAGLGLAVLTAGAAWWVWTAIPGFAGRLGYGDLSVVIRVVALAAVFAAALRVENLLDRGSAGR